MTHAYEPPDHKVDQLRLVIMITFFMLVAGHLRLVIMSTF